MKKISLGLALMTSAMLVAVFHSGSSRAETCVSKKFTEDMFRFTSRSDEAVPITLQAKIDRIFGRSANAEENEIIARATKRGLLGSVERTDVESVEELGRFTQFLNGEERKQFYKETLGLLEKASSPATATPEARGTAMKTIMELAALEVPGAHKVARYEACVSDKALF